MKKPRCFRKSGPSYVQRAATAGQFLKIGLSFGKRRLIMIDLIEKNRDALDQLCTRYQVKHLELFGSAATDNFDQDTSDLDFLVDFRRTDELSLADQYFGLLADLVKLFGRKVDLVMTRALRNPYLIKEVNQTRRTLYAAQVA